MAALPLLSAWRAAEWLKSTIPAGGPGFLEFESMSRRTNLAVSVLAITTIFFGVRYAVARERLRDPQYLHWIYADENRQHFGDALPDAHLRSGDLTDQDEGDTYTLGVTYALDENYFVIVLAPKWN